MLKDQTDSRLMVVNLADSPVEAVDKMAENIADDEISPGKKITMHFSLGLKQVDPGQSSKLIDSNFDKAPVNFTFGDGNLLPGFENALLGFKAGFKRTLYISCDNAFGRVNEDNIQGYPRYQFPADLVLEEGLMVNFSDAAGNDQAGVVKDFNSAKVTIDFNHPLAGEEIEFKVEIIAVEV